MKYLYVLALVLFSILCSGTANAKQLYGITQSELVIIDPTNPNDVQVVGSLNLPAQLSILGPISYHPVSQTFVGSAWDTGTLDQFLISIDPLTGTATVIANLGNTSVVGGIEAFEYVDALNSLVVSTNVIGSAAKSTELLLLDLNGSSTHLVSTTLDNDVAVYDPSRNLFYTVDPNGLHQLVNVDITTGTSVNLGAIPSAIELAFRETDESIYAIIRADNSLYRIATTAGGSPISVSLVGTIAVDNVIGIAFAPVNVNAAELVTLYEFENDYTSENDPAYDGIASPGVPPGVTGVTFDIGQVGQAAIFEGGTGSSSNNPAIDHVDSTMEIPPSDFNGGLSIMGWINPEDQVSGYILSHGDSWWGDGFTTSEYGWGAYVGSPGLISLFLRDTSDRRMYGDSDSGTVTVGTWNHIALTWDGSTSGGIKIYLNGQETTTTWRHHNGVFSGLNGSTPLSLRIGATHANSINEMRGYVGGIDHFSIWKGVLTPAEILADYEATSNTQPTANAGTGETVHVGDVVTLDGSASFDPDGNVPLTYEWSFVSWSGVTQPVLSDSSIVNPQFTPNLTGNYEIQLIVTDSLGAVSIPHSVLISTTNSLPIADAGLDQSITLVGDTVQLSGNQSYDPDGDDITYQWTFVSIPGSSTTSLIGADTATPTFVADVHDDYIVQLIVSDPWTQSLSVTVKIGFENIKPLADAGTSRSVVIYDTVALDGSGSSDANGDSLTYSWSLTSWPTGSTPQITDPTSEVTSFVPYLPGTYVVELKVNDGFIDSDHHSIQIQAIVTPTVIIDTLQDSGNVITALPLSVLKNKNMQNTFLNKLNSVIANVEAGNHADALDKLQNDIMGKMNGCAETGEPDKNDWIKNCVEQDQVYPILMTAVTLLQDLLNQ